MERPLDAPAPGTARISRADWLALAEQVLISHGVASVKILGLANRLGVSRSSFYWHFESRQDLLDQLLESWEARNTRALIEHAARPAGNICRAVMNLFECWLDPDLFNPQLDFAVREWARRSDSVRARVDQADRQRVEALTAMFARHGFAEAEALVRARIVYFMQIGYYALVEAEPIETRTAYLEPYLIGFTGARPDPAEMAEFRHYVLGLRARDRAGGYESG